MEIAEVTGCWLEAKLMPKVGREAGKLGEAAGLQHVEGQAPQVLGQGG